MEVRGGIEVKNGERGYKQPFRVGIINADDYGNDFWTNEPQDASRVFAIIAERIQRQRKP